MTGTQDIICIGSKHDVYMTCTQDVICIGSKHVVYVPVKIIGVEPMIYRRSWPIEAMMGVR